MPGPHDRLFRYLFNHPARAAALLRHNLPASLFAEVDGSTLRRESGTLVEGERETRNDLLFSARSLHGGRAAALLPYRAPVHGGAEHGAAAA
jgi:predicted transposase YdaD